MSSFTKGPYWFRIDYDNGCVEIYHIRTNKVVSLFQGDYDVIARRLRYWNNTRKAKKARRGGK